MGMRAQAPAQLAELAEAQRRDLGTTRDPQRRAALGQFLTPAAVARLMASLIGPLPSTVRLLDAGAGVGMLTAALCDALLRRPGPLKQIHVTAYELEPAFAPPLRQVLAACEQACAAREAGPVLFSDRLQADDFIRDATAQLKANPGGHEYNCAIVNPPYRKLRADSPERLRLREVGIEVNNLYTAFLALLIHLLTPGGTLCAITPRSFCNGPYYLAFRKLLLAEMELKEVLVFDTRDRTFTDDKILQETIIWVARKGNDDNPLVRVRAAVDPATPPHTDRTVPHHEIAPPAHPQRFLFLALAEPDDQEQALRLLPASLPDLNLQVATGRVVDFRARHYLKRHLRDVPAKDTAPLLYPAHLGTDGLVRWPRANLRKPQAIAANVETAPLLLSPAPYVLLKRFSSKEQRRRLMAAVYDPAQLPGAESVAIENHLNVFTGSQLTLELAWGLCAFLNASCVDRHFRIFSGHTQVNATDLRSLRYPTRPVLEQLGRRVLGALPQQDELDRLVTEALGL